MSQGSRLDAQTLRAARQHAEASVDACERHKVCEGFQHCIDAVWSEIRALFEHGELEQREFVEMRARLWQRREQVCEALLPEAQREKVRALAL